MKERIVQFGEGNFLRGFVDYFIHKLNEKDLFDGSIVVVQPIETGLAELLNEQKGEYNLFLRGIENKKKVVEHTRVTSISRAINPYTNFCDYITLAHNPDVRFIVSNTTEAGIAYDSSCKATDAPPSSFPAKLTLLLLERFKKGLSGFVILSCELIDYNGDQLQKCVLKYVEQWQLGEEFAQWVKCENKFCNTLVDRIVTGYPKDEAEILNKEIGYQDKLLDTGEIFHLWVIEGDFENELPLREAGFNVVWTDDVSPYKKRKVRILNGAHTSIVCAGILYGLNTVGECLEDEVMKAFLKKCVFDEIVPVLGNTQEDCDFASAVLERFSNPYIKHQLHSIALNSVSKFAVRVLPTILEYKKKYGNYPYALTFAFASLIRYYKINEPDDATDVVQFMKKSSLDEILENTDLWNVSLIDMKNDIQCHLDNIRTKGMGEALK